MIWYRFLPPSPIDSIKSPMTRRIFVDTDTASDDAVALLMAFKHCSDSLVGIGVVAGNVPLEQAIQNALFVRELCHSQTPVYAGAARPLVRLLETAQNVHGHICTCTHHTTHAHVHMHICVCPYTQQSCVKSFYPCAHHIENKMQVNKCHDDQRKHHILWLIIT